MFKLVLEKAGTRDQITNSHWKWKWSHVVVSNSLRPHGLQPTRLLCPWDFPGNSTGVGCHCLLIIEKASEFQKNIYFCFIDYAKAFNCVDQNKLWKILKEMRRPDHLTCLLRNLYASQEATVRTGHGITDWFQIGKGVRQGCMLSPYLFNLYAEYIMRSTGLDEA